MVTQSFRGVDVKCMVQEGHIYRQNCPKENGFVTDLPLFHIKYEHMRNMVVVASLVVSLYSR